MNRRSFFIAFLLLALPALLALAPHDRPVPPIRPQIPAADRSTGNRVFLERAEVLRKETFDSFLTVVGDVVFTKGPMTMKCDSAHFFEGSESLQAFGNVSMEQGDTLFVYADELDYDGMSEIATLYADPGKKVRLINRDVKLETDIFIYDLAIDLGYYEVGGKLTDPSNTLTSLYGEYVPSTKEANFYTNVHLNSRNQTDTLDIYSDTLYYNTATHIAQLFSPSEVINKRGTIYTTLGIYDTDSNRTTLYDRSTIVTAQHHTLTADTIFYDRTAGYGEAWGGMVLTDSVHDAQVSGNYGFYNEIADTAFVTGRAMLKHYNGPDTLYLHGRYIRTAALYDTVHVAADSVRVYAHRYDPRRRRASRGTLLPCRPAGGVRLAALYRARLHPAHVRRPGGVERGQADIRQRNRDVAQRQHHRACHTARPGFCRAANRGTAFPAA